MTCTHFFNTEMMQFCINSYLSHLPVLSKGQNYALEEMLYNPSPLIDHGMANFTIGLSNQVAGRVNLFAISNRISERPSFFEPSFQGAGGRNMPKKLHPVAVEAVKTGRKARLQPFNRYREYLRLPKYKSFEELTGNGH